MAVIPDGTEMLGGRMTWRLKDPVNGQVFRTQNPIQAMQLGHAPPKPSDFTNQNAGAAPTPMPDQRLASNADMSVPEPAMSAVSDAPTNVNIDPWREPNVQPPMADETPPNEVSAAPEPAPQPERPMTPAEREQLLNEEFPLPSKYKYTAPRKAGFNAISKTTKGADPKEVAGINADYQQHYQDQIDFEQSKYAAEAADKDAIAAKANLEKLQATKEADDLKAEEDRKTRWKRDELYKLDKDEEAAAAKHPDSNRFWSRKGKSSEIGSYIMMALYEIGSGLRGSNGPNAVSQLITNQIDRDIADQEAAIAAGKDKAAKNKLAFRSLLENGEDPAFIREKLKAVQLRAAMATAAEAEAIAGSQKARDAAHQTYFNLNKEYLQSRERMAGMKSEEANYKYDQGAVGGWGLKSMAERKKDVIDTNEARTGARALMGGQSMKAQEAGETTFATEDAKGRAESVSGNEKAIAGPAISSVNDELSNLKAYANAQRELDDVIASGEDVELNPSGWRSMQPVDEFFNGKASADEDRFGKGGRRAMMIADNLTGSIRSKTAGVLSPEEYARQLSRDIAGGSIPEMKKNIERRANNAMNSVASTLLGMSPRERERYISSQDSETQQLIRKAISGRREGGLDLSANPR